MRSARSEGDRPSAMVVKPRTSENSTVSSRLSAASEYSVGALAISSTNSGGTY